MRELDKLVDGEKVSNDKRKGVWGVEDHKGGEARERERERERERRRIQAEVEEQASLPL